MEDIEKSLCAPEKWSEQEKDVIWEKGSAVESLDPDEYRMDAAGALIRRDAYNQKHRFGWRIDGIVPTNGEVDLSLLRPLFWRTMRPANRKLLENFTAIRVRWN